MIKVLFVCLGNICRSPMAEFMMKSVVREKGMESEFYIDSAATSFEEVGNGVHYGTRKKLEEMGISYTDHRARRITPEDYEKFDYIIGMEESNIKNIKRIVGEDREDKIYKLLDFSKNPRDIADPWYTGNFEETYEDIKEGLEGFLEYLKDKKNLKLEKGLPRYLERDLQNLKEGLKNKVSYIDCLINELQGSVNSAYVDGDISEEQCDYLYEKYIRKEI
ncbi:MAG: low molecular weight phosphotyrosine protein phosphatase [Clostridia bacterium]|nr:low molecular weight phosphotyrosine protein phosphatase [Clostridia bacterium]